MVTKKVDFALWYMRSKYCSWWLRRVSTPELLEAEREQWAKVLGPYSFKQIQDAAYVVRKHYQYRPPYAHEFVRLMDKRASRPMDVVTGKRFDAPVVSVASKRFFDDARSRLCG